MPMPVVADRPGVLYLDNIHIDEDINKASWKGSESAELYRLYNNEISDSIAIYVGQLQTETDDNKKNNLQAELSRKYSEIVWQLTQKMIADHPESYATAYAVMRLSEQIADVNEIEKMYHGLSPDNQQNKFGLAVSNRLRILQGAIAGKAAVDNFVLADLKGDSVSFDSFRGKYVLVDFWASWCGPCIASFPHLKQLYSKYKDQGFEILGVSVDQKADAWRKAAKEQDLPWTLVLDTKNIAKDFAVNAIPATFLINPEGKIIEAEVGMGGKIDKKLESLFSE
jgi:thiol-disulfide isomerase/thioredoxin